MFTGHFFPSMYNKTIIRLSFFVTCIQNNKSLNKSYQPMLKAEADNSYLDLDYSGLKKKLL